MTAPRPRHLLALCALAAPAAAQEAPPARSVPPTGIDRSGFVQVDGHRFVLQGRPFRFVGANASIMHGLPHRAAMEATLDAIAADGLRVVRVWALGEQPDGAEPWARDFAFRVGRDGWVEESFAHLDRLLDAARARDLRVVVVLANRWADYGGVPRYLDWAGATAASTPTLPELALARFYDNPTARSLYRAHVERVVTRVNTVNHRAYRDDPTILAWELINESDALARDRGALVGWTADMARFVHALDAVHLVAAGHIGYARRAQRETWLAIQRLPEIDYADAHAYPTQLASVRGLDDLDDYVDDHVQLAHHVVGKPFVWGELGFSTSQRTHRGLPRTRWFERFLARSELDGVDGAMAWIYTPSADRPSEHGLFVDGPAAARTRDVRDVLARYASRWRSDAGASRNPRLGAARGEAPIWATRRRFVGPSPAWAAPTSSGGLARWSITPESYAFGESEHLGRWDGFALSHVYAEGVASLSYRLRVTPASRRVAMTARRLRVRLRASSELPGRGEASDASEGSTLRLSIDGASMGELELPRDDGLGAWVEHTSDDPRALAALRAVGVHTLRLEVPDGPRANGLCVYGAPTGHGAIPEGAGDLPGRIVVAVER